MEAGHFAMSPIRLPPRMVDSHPAEAVAAAVVHSQGGGGAAAAVQGPPVVGRGLFQSPPPKRLRQERKDEKQGAAPPKRQRGKLNEAQAFNEIEALIMQTRRVDRAALIRRIAEEFALPAIEDEDGTDTDDGAAERPRGPFSTPTVSPVTRPVS
jgi:hypothetical protein